MFDHKIWDDPDLSGEIAARLVKDDTMTAKSLFVENGLTAQWVLGVFENCAKALIAFRPRRRD